MIFKSSLFSLLLFCLLVLTFLATPSGIKGTEPLDIKTEEEDLRDQWQKRLQRLMEICDELKMPLEKEISRRYDTRSKDLGFVLVKYSRIQFPNELPDDASENQISWHRALRRLRNETAERFAQLGEEALLQKKGYDAWQLFQQTLAINSDNVDARRHFGYVLLDNIWRTTFEKRQLEKGLVDHPVFGWLEKDYIARYEAGERYFRGKWMTSKEETHIRQDENVGWRIESEHYLMITTYSLEEGVRIIRKLENFYDVWTRLFYRFMATEGQWNSALQVGKRLDSKKHKIIFYPNRKEYLEELQILDNTGNLKYSHGGYFPDVETIFIYKPEPQENTDMEIMLVHEATHQLFQECRFDPDSIKRKKYTKKPLEQNYWITEGIATYMETYREEKHDYTIGGLHSIRFLRAAERCLEPDGYIPLRNYSRLSMRDFQTHNNIGMLYTQAAGLTLFFLHAENGKYRNVFINYLYSVYERFDTLDILEKLSGKTFEQLDDEYKNFMRGLKFE